ncbi:unnamed protein product, partial [Ixodes pacificus]
MRRKRFRTRQEDGSHRKSLLFPVVDVWGAVLSLSKSTLRLLDLSGGNATPNGDATSTTDHRPAMGAHPCDAINGASTDPDPTSKRARDRSEPRTSTALPTIHSPLPAPNHKLLLGRPGKLVRNRPISRSERHLKAASTPEFHSGSSEDVCREVRRPWSQLYTDVEAEQLFAAVGSMSSLPKDDVAANQGLSTGGSSLPPRYSSLRASSPRLIADSVLQKFRKTFSMRFQRSRKGSTTSLPAKDEGSLSSAEDWQTSWPPGSPHPDVPAMAASKKLAQSSAPLARGEDDEEGSGGFRLGPAILRASREQKLHRKNRELRGSKCSSADSGIQLEAAGAGGEQMSEVSAQGVTHHSLHAKFVCIIYVQEMSGFEDLISSETTLSANGKGALRIAEHKQSECYIQLRRAHLDTCDAAKKSFNFLSQQFSMPPPIKTRTERCPPTLRRQKGRGRLRRSISQPVDLEKSEKMDLLQKEQLNHGLSDQEASREPSTASSEEDFSSDGESYFQNQIPKDVSLLLNNLNNNYEGVTYVEALWDHVTLDSEELAFHAGEVIEVTDMSDKDWWWGSIEQRNGWFPAAFVRLRVNQEDTVEDCMTKMADGTLTKQKPRKMSVSLLSNEQVRAKVVMEIVNTERDFVHHLKDVVEGYLKPVLRRPDMFSEERRATIFGNIEQLYAFQSRFLDHLEASVNWEQPHLSQIGSVFLQHKLEFRIYSEYCNNHPLAVSELQEVYADSKYVHFFEACRLLQDMIDISLDGFLLTPVQKICKYPLQLAELLKYTRPEHQDYWAVRDALIAMRGVAHMVNERKRRMECLEKLAEWQTAVFNWEGPDLLDTSSMLVHSGEAVRVSSSWSRDVVSLFLFDNLLVYCKKDMIKRNTMSYKGRLNMNSCRVVDVEDGKDSQFGVSVKNAWKVYCSSREKWYLFFAKTAEEKDKWLQAFKNERDRVRDDKEQG